MHLTQQTVSSTPANEVDLDKLDQPIMRIVAALLVEGFDVDDIDIQNETWYMVSDTDVDSLMNPMPALVGPIQMVSLLTSVEQPHHALEIFDRFRRIPELSDGQMQLVKNDDTFTLSFRFEGSEKSVKDLDAERFLEFLRTLPDVEILNYRYLTPAVGAVNHVLYVTTYPLDYTQTLNVENAIKDSEFAVGYADIETLAGSSEIMYFPRDPR